MAKKVTVESTEKRRYNKSIIAPIDGEIQLDAKGRAEVSSQCAEALVQGKGWRILKNAEALAESTKKLKKKAEEVEEEYEDEEEEFDPDQSFEEDEETDEYEEDEEQEEEDEADDLDQVIEMIKSLKRLKDLRQWIFENLGVTQEDIEDHDNKLKDLRQWAIDYVTNQANSEE